MVEISQIHFSIVGCGHIAHKHVKAIEMTPQAKLSAVCDIDTTKLAPFLKDGTIGYTDYDEMLANKDIDVVNICTPSGLHTRLAVKAAKAGKHIIVEKPIALTLSDTDEIMKACKENGVKLAVVHPNRYRPALIELKKTMDAGLFGRLSHVNATVRWNRNQEYYDQAPWRGTKNMDGGVLMNQAIHNLDLLLWLCGEVEEVQAYTATRLRKIESEDVAVATLRFKSGVLGIVEAATTIYPKNLEESLSIFGEKGTAIIGGPTANYIKHWNLESYNQEETDALMDKINQDPFGEAGHLQIVKDMIESISTGKEPAITGEDGRLALQLVLAIYEAANLKRPYKI